jgi:hypothetical protein
VENTPQPAHGQQQQQQHQHQQQRHASSVPGPAAAVVAAADMAAAMEAATSSSSDVSGDDLEGVSEAEGSALSLPGLSTGPAEAAHGAQAAAAAGGSRGVHVAELQGAPGQGSWPEQVQLAARGRQELGGVDSYDDTGSEDAGSEAEEGPINVRAVSAEASSAAGVSDDGSAAATAEPATSGAMRDSAAEGATSVPAAAQQQQPQSVQPAPPARTNPSAAPPLLMPSLMGVNPWGDAGASSSMASGPGVQALGLPPGVMYRGSSAGGARASVGGGAAGGTLSVPGPRSSTGGGAAGVPMLSPGSRLSLGESLAGSGRPSLSTEHSEDPRLSLGGVSVLCVTGVLQHTRKLQHCNTSMYYVQPRVFCCRVLSRGTQRQPTQVHLSCHPPQETTPTAPRGTPVPYCWLPADSSMCALKPVLSRTILWSLLFIDMSLSCGVCTCRCRRPAASAWRHP